MEPISTVLATAAFVSLAKDLIDLSEDATTLYRTIRGADKLLQKFSDECTHLSTLLRKFGDSDVLLAQDSLARPEIERLKASVDKLKIRIAELRALSTMNKLKSRLQMPANLRKLKVMLAEIEAAKSYASLALQLLQYEMMSTSLSQASLQQATMNDLRSDIMLAFRGIIRAGSIQRTSLELGSRPHFDEGLTHTTDRSVMLQCSPIRRRSTKRSKPYRHITIQPWFATRVFTFVLEGSYRNWSCGLRTQQVLQLDAPILTAIRAGELPMFKHYLDVGAAHADDLIQGLEPSPYLPSRTTDQSPLFEYILHYGCRPLETIQVMLGYLDADRNIDLLWSILRFISLECSYILQGPHNDRSPIYKLLLETYDLDLVLEWPTPSLYHHLCPIWPAKPGAYLLPIIDQYSLFTYLHSRQQQFHPGCQQYNEAIILQQDPLISIVSLPMLLLLFGIDRTNLSQDMKDWYLHAALAQLAVKRPKTYDDPLIMLQRGASPTSIIKGSSPIGTILRSARRSNKMSIPFDIMDRCRLWLMHLTSAAIDIQVYLQYERRHCSISRWIGLHFSCPSEDDSTLGYQIRYHMRLRDIEWMSASKSIRLWFEITWRPNLWKYRSLPGAWPRHKHSPDYMLNYPGREQGQEWELTSRAIPSRVNISVSSDDLLEHFGYLPGNFMPCTQDDHGLVARSALRSRLPRRRQRRAHSQPRSLKGCCWKIIDELTNKPSIRWMKNCHVCPFEPHRYLHWFEHTCGFWDDGEMPFDEELRACLGNIMQQPQPSGVGSVRTFEDFWRSQHQRLHTRRHLSFKPDTPSYLYAHLDYFSDRVIRQYLDG